MMNRRTSLLLTAALGALSVTGQAMAQAPAPGGTKLVAFPVSKLQLDATKAMMQGATKRAIQSMPAIDLSFGSG